MRVYENIWAAYKLQCETSHIARSGSILCGATSPIAYDDIYKKTEFVSEHQGRVAYLYLLAMVYGKQPFTVRSGSVSESLRHALFLLSHDIGELAGGDIPDDGSRRHSDVKVKEAKIFRELLDYYPGEDRDWFMRTYEGFESYSGTVETQFDKALDKLDAVLYALFLKDKGVEGDVRKKNPPSKQDLELAELIGSSAMAEIWCIHMRIATKNMNPRIIEFIDEILVVAFSDVYRDEILKNGNKLPKCLLMDVSNINL